MLIVAGHLGATAVEASVDNYCIPLEDSGFYSSATYSSNGNTVCSPEAGLQEVSYNILCFPARRIKSSGNAVGDYSPYGERSQSAAASLLTLAQAPAGVTLRHHFTGQEDQWPDFIVPYTDFGARQYNTNLRRWMVPDPIGEAYYDISPYVYCAGDPVNTKDIQGSFLRIWYKDERGNDRYFDFSGGHIRHRNEYVQAVVDAYNYNKTNWERAGYRGMSPLTEIVEGNYKINVRNSELAGDKYNKTYNTIYWNNETGLFTGDKVLSPATGLAHEADHALSYLTDPIGHERRTSANDKNYGNAEEKRVIQGVEQKTAEANGEINHGCPTRMDHYYRPSVIVVGATSTIIDEERTIELKKKLKEYELYKHSQD